MAIIYLAEEVEVSAAGYGDSWDIAITYDLDEAIREARYRYDRLTDREKKHKAVEIRGYEADVDTTKNAQTEFVRLISEIPFNDSVYYLKIAD